MKNKKIGLLVLSCVFTFLSQFIYAAVEEEHETYIKIRSCFLEQAIEESVSLRNYGIENDGGRHKYEVSFLGSAKVHHLEVIDEQGNICNQEAAIASKFIPQRSNGETGVWKLTAIADGVCKPKNIKVVEDASNSVVYDILVPEIEARLDSSNPEKVSSFIITSNSINTIEVLGFFDLKGNRINEFEFDGPATIDAHNPSLIVTAKPTVTYIKKGETSIQKGSVKYRISGEEKSMKFGVEYYNDMDKNIILPNEKVADQSWFSNAKVAAGAGTFLALGIVALYHFQHQQPIHNVPGGHLALAQGANILVRDWFNRVNLQQVASGTINIPGELIQSVADAMGINFAQAQAYITRMIYWAIHGAPQGNNIELPEDPTDDYMQNAEFDT